MELMDAIRHRRSVRKFTDHYVTDDEIRAQELGLGPVVVGSMDHDACAKVALLPPGNEVMAAIPIGRPAIADQKAPSRKELKSFMHLDTFGEQYGKIY
jgi:nitroreductase